MSTCLVLWRPPAGRSRRWFGRRRCLVPVIAFLLLPAITPTGAQAVTVTGKVIDKQTRQPVKRFQIIPGEKRANSFDWSRRDSQIALDGRFQMDLKKRDVVRIEAEGYEPAVSREIESGEGSVTIEFALSPGRNFDFLPYVFFSVVRPKETEIPKPLDLGVLTLEKN